MKLWLRRLLGLCEHEWITRFRGSASHGVECVKCGKAELRFEWNDRGEPEGWFERDGRPSE